MNFKNTAADITTMGVQVSNAKNRMGKVISIIISVIFLVIGLIAFLFSWQVALVLIGISAIFFGLSKLSKFAIKNNERTIEKIQAMKETNPEEAI